MSIRDILVEAGLHDPEANLHSWRCSYPDRFAPCTFLDELVTDLEAEQQAAVEAVFAFHPEWTVNGMCKPGCFACQRLDELYAERAAGNEEGRQQAIRDCADDLDARVARERDEGDAAGLLAGLDYAAECVRALLTEGSE